MRNKLQIVVCALLCGTSLQAKETLLDYWDEAPRLFTVASDGQSLYQDLDRRRGQNYKSAYFQVDYTDKQVGDLSVVYDAGKAGSAKTFGFVSSLWGGVWELDDQFSLNLHVKVTGSAPGGACTIALVDQAGKQAVTTIATLGQDDWQALQLPQAAFKAEDGFDFSKVTACRLKAELPKDALVWLDGVHFAKGETVVGITDKPIGQRVAEQKATKEVRVKISFEASAKKDPHPEVSAFAMMYLNQDLPKANQILRESCLELMDKDLNSLLHTPLFCRFYFLFSSRYGQFPGRLEAETEKILLETIWERMKHKNDIHRARQSTWSMDGSENHDLNIRAGNLVSSRIFMNEPDYKDRIYPDYGFGSAYYEKSIGFYGKGVDRASRHGGGRANHSDGKEYTAKEHYEAWLSYLKEYFSERSKHGFFVENSSPGYAKHSMNMIDLAYAYSGDEELHGIIDDFMSLYWADWVQTGIAGISGGPKTRHHKLVGGYDSHTNMIRFLLGSAGSGYCWNYWSMINGYEMPEVIQAMALDREGMGTFVYQSRGIGEERDEQPRPAGNEWTLMINPNSRFLKYVYVTPHYTLGTQMDHPQAIHSHLSKAGRWHGMTVCSDPNVRIVPVGFPQEPTIYGGKGKISMEIMYKTLQVKNTLIMQRSRSFNQIHPDWFPIYNQRTDQGVYIGNAWDERLEEDGWIFLREGDVYAGVRVALAAKAKKGEEKLFHDPNDAASVKMSEQSYTWLYDNEYIRLNDRYAPMIIQSGDKNEYGSFASFRDAVKSAECNLYNTVVPTYNILAYTPPQEGAPEITFNGANNEIPMLDNQYINYEYPMTFDSPYLKSKYGSGKIDIQYGGEELKLDFSDKPWWKLW